MWPNRVSSTGPLAFELDALPTALRGPELCNSYTMVCLPIRADNPRALANRLLSVHEGKLWYNYFIPSLSV